MQTAMNLNEIAEGFANPALGTQKVFRQVLNAMAHPGRIIELDEWVPVEGLDEATTALALTLLDFETSLWTDLPRGASALQWVTFHCGSPMGTSVSEADFALVTRPESMPRLESFCLGSEGSPHQSTTLILQVEYLEARPGKRLMGPGIDGSCDLDAGGLPDHFWSSRKNARALFPIGVDILFACNNRIAAMPRTTDWEETPCM